VTTDFKFASSSPSLQALGEQFLELKRLRAKVAELEKQLASERRTDAAEQSQQAEHPCRTKD